MYSYNLNDLFIVVLFLNIYYFLSIWQNKFLKFKSYCNKKNLNNCKT